MQVQPTTTITLDGQSYDVAKLSDEIQNMVAYLDDWRQREVDAASELLLVRGAIRDLQATLSNAIQQEVAEAIKRAQDLGLIPTAAPAVPAAPAANDAPVPPATTPDAAPATPAVETPQTPTVSQ